MKIKVGETVKNAVLTSKLSKGDIVNQLGKSRTWLTNVLDDEYMSTKYILQIGKVLNVDFSQSIPGLSKVLSFNTVEEPTEEYSRMNNIELRDKLIEIQSKYIELLEQHSKLLEELKNTGK